jgi:glycosyltransferase involved in cell wall biosynthesis
MRVAVIHDWLTTYAGAERVLEQILQVYPVADVYTIVDFLPPQQRGFLGGCMVYTSSIQKLPFARRHYRSYLPLMPLAVESFDLSEYDLVISSSHAVAKGVITGPDQLHVCMCYSPIRYAWDLQHQYLREAGLTTGLKGWLAKSILHRMRIWDLRTVNGVDDFIAISDFIRRRIAKVYRRSSTIIYPPVDVEGFSLNENKDDYYVTVSRMVPYKKMDLIVEAFTMMPERQLVVIGDGPEYQRIVSKAGDNVRFLGFQDDDTVRDYLQRARAFVFAAEEDFGIAPLEAQACGTPVIAYGKGGALETIIGLNEGQGEGVAPTGVFFYQQTTESLCAAVYEYESRMAEISPAACRENALRFSPQRFRNEFKTFIDQAIVRFNVS